jgi:hypothetical protein
LEKIYLLSFRVVLPETDGLKLAFLVWKSRPQLRLSVGATERDSLQESNFLREVNGIAVAVGDRRFEDDEAGFRMVASSCYPLIHHDVKSLGPIPFLVWHEIRETVNSKGILNA